MSEKTRQIVIVALVILTVGLIGAAIYLGISIQNNQAPTTSEAAGGSCGGAGGDGACAGVAGHINCGGRAQANCQALSCVGCSWTPATSTSNSSTTSTPGNTSGSANTCSGQCITAPSCGQQGRVSAGGSCSNINQVCCNAVATSTCSGTCITAPSCGQQGRVSAGGSCTNVNQVCCNSVASSSTGSVIGTQCCIGGQTVNNTFVNNQECQSAGGTPGACASTGGGTGGGGGGTSSTPASSSSAVALCGSDGRSNCTMRAVGGCSNGQQRQTCYSNVNSSIGCYDQFNSCGGTGNTAPAPVATPTVTCYSCTSATTDANACVGITINGTTCSAGTSASSTGCAAAVGGSCPGNSTTGSITCYRCSLATNDANACEPITESGTTCITGTTSDPGSCAAAAGGVCPVIITDGTGGGTLPNTAIISDQADAALLGGLLLIGGLFALRFQAIDKTLALANNSLKSVGEFYFGEENVRRRKLNKLKGSRSKFEKDLEKDIENR